MRVPYSFSVIRYVHDVVAEEFVNVGVAMYAPKISFIDALSTKKYARLSKIFVDVDGSQFRSLMTFLDTKIFEVKDRLQSDLGLDSRPKDVLEILTGVFPLDDSSLQFSGIGEGLTENPEKTLNELYERYVERSSVRNVRLARTDDEVWRTFKKPLEQQKVLRYLRPHAIVTKNYEYQFEHAWKNDKWRALEAVSFDLEDGHSIVEKAARWVGRSAVLEDAKEKFDLVLLLGKPQDEKLKLSYVKAENILHKINLSHEFVREEDAEKFASHLHTEISTHGGE